MTRARHRLEIDRLGRRLYYAAELLPGFLDRGIWRGSNLKYKNNQLFTELAHHATQTMASLP